MPYNPELAQAVTIVLVDDPSQDGLVVDELVVGYMMAGQLLRPAQVSVGRYSKEEYASTGENHGSGEGSGTSGTAQEVAGSGDVVER
jgi:hypothetical protein